MTTPARPFTSFSFTVDIYVEDAASPLVQGAFSECDGLEMSHEVKTIREGGAPDRQIRLNGMAAFGTLTLRRGMTEDFGLWQWFEKSLADPRLRASVQVVLLAPDGATQRAGFELSRCVPVKIKAPQLNAKDGQIAVEELQIAYETLQLVLPT